MHEGLIERWNAVVKPNDTVYNLGDVAFGSDIAAVRSVLRRLNGKQHLILGNHDKLITNNIARLDGVFETIQHYLFLRHNIGKMAMFHFPMAIWDQKHHGAYHLHGHSHGNFRPSTGRIVDVGIDSNLVTGQFEMRPFSLVEIARFMSKRRDEISDHHK